MILTRPVSPNTDPEPILHTRMLKNRILELETQLNLSRAALERTRDDYRTCLEELNRTVRLLHEKQATINERNQQLIEDLSNLITKLC